jgi:hypothetical protein
MDNMVLKVSPSSCPVFLTINNTSTMVMAMYEEGMTVALFDVRS